MTGVGVVSIVAPSTLRKCEIRVADRGQENSSGALRRDVMSHNHPNQEPSSRGS